MTLPAVGDRVPRRGNAVTRGLGRFVHWILGWRIEGEVPNVPSTVTIVAPHTSNWDFVVALAAVFALGLSFRWLGKDSLFRPPFGTLLRWCGGIPVRREVRDGLVEAAAASLRSGDVAFLAIAPEGTRRKVERWRSGFHRIARAAEVPIWPVAIDYRIRAIVLFPLFQPTDDLEGDLERLQALYGAAMARRPEAY